MPWLALPARAQRPLALGLASALLLTLTAAPLAALVLALVLPGAPAAGLAADAADAARAASHATSAWDTLGATLGTARPWTLLAETLGLASAVTLGALLVGVPTGALAAKTDAPLRRLAVALHVFPAALTPLLLALGWFHLVGRQGPLGDATTADLLFGPVGVVAVLSLALAPIITALTALGLRGVDASLEEAARAAAPPMAVFARVLLPLSAPAIGLGALIVFALALSEVGVPMFLRVDTYSAAVFSRLGGVRYAPAEAVALALPMLAVGLALLALDRRLLGRRSFAAVGLRPTRAPRLPLGRLRPLAAAFLVSVATLSVAPLVGLALAAGPRGLASALDWLPESLGTSLLTAALAATVITTLGVVLGLALARAAGRGGSRARGLPALLDAVALLAFVTPAAVLAVGLVAVWNRPATHAIYASVAILVVGLTARYATVGVRASAAVFHHTPPLLEQAAAAFGAGYFRRLTRVLLPLAGPRLAAAWLLAFVFALRDLDTVIAFYPPGREPLPVQIFTLEANGSEALVAGLSLWHVAATAAALGVAWAAAAAYSRRAARSPRRSP